MHVTKGTRVRGTPVGLACRLVHLSLVCLSEHNYLLAQQGLLPTTTDTAIKQSATLLYTHPTVLQQTRPS